MQINGVPAGYPDPTALEARGQTSEPFGGGGSRAVEVQLGSAVGPRAALAEILSKFDVTDISPTEFSEMIQKLYEAGAIAETELQQLTAIRHDLDTDGVEADESIDLLEYFVEKIEKLQRRLGDLEGPPAEHQQLGPLLRRLDWIEKFALIQSAPDAAGLDAVA